VALLMNSLVYGRGIQSNFEPFSGRQPLNINYGNETRKRGKYIKQLRDTGIIKWILDSKNDIAEGPMRHRRHLIITT